MEDDQYTLTDAGIDQIIRIDEMFRNTDYDLDRIAWEIGVDNPMLVRVLYGLGVQMGVIDALNALEESDGFQ